jgi:agmatine deiminase
MENHKKYYMPAEWELHERTIVEWPVEASLCWPENYDKVVEIYGKMINGIAQFEPVTVIVNKETLKEAQGVCKGEIDFVVIPHDDAWARDNGPTFVVNQEGGIAGISWQFNAWGEKYSPYNLDNEVSSKLLHSLNIPEIVVPIILEGGSIHVDGEGTLLATKECLLNKNRNRDLSCEEIEEVLKKQLNVSKIIWLNRGLYGDETDGHIDNIACFAKPGTVLIQTCHDKNDLNYQITKENLSILEKATDAQGRKLTIIEMPTPPMRQYNNKRLTLSYLNFYFVNGGLILPVFGEEAVHTDEKAETILKSIFPDREIYSIHSIELIKEGGNVHCITQQMPRRIN